ncbi:hypothetical protein GXW82_29260 [Streptacidiphilus sp. 4-A2]|nr:hypothetical protein [Streptacidiphilus sp. 4-A2]
MSGKRVAGMVTPSAASVDVPAGSRTRADNRRSQKRGRRKALKIVGIGTATVLVVAGTGAGYLYFHLAGNIKSAPSTRAATRPRRWGSRSRTPSAGPRTTCC